jgi:hypothetical protein
MEDNVNIDSELINPEVMLNIIQDMIRNPSQLASGFNIFSTIQGCRGFYISLLKIILESNSSNSEIKLASSVILNFLRKNWSDESGIFPDEKLEIFSTLLNNLLIENYYIANLISKLLAIISAKEWPNSYNMLIKKILKSFETSDEKQTECLLRIMINIMNECDDRIAQMTSELMPIIIDVFKNSTVSLLFN